MYSFYISKFEHIFEQNLNYIYKLYNIVHWYIL